MVVDGRGYFQMCGRPHVQKIQLQNCLGFE